jgi:hypothetical protein
LGPSCAAESKRGRERDERKAARRLRGTRVGGRKIWKIINLGAHFAGEEKVGAQRPFRLAWIGRLSWSDTIGYPTGRTGDEQEHEEAGRGRGRSTLPVSTRKRGAGHGNTCAVAAAGKSKSHVWRSWMDHRRRAARQKLSRAASRIGSVGKGPPTAPRALPPPQQPTCDRTNNASGPRSKGAVGAGARR